MFTQWQQISNNSKQYITEMQKDYDWFTELLQRFCDCVKQI